MVFLLFFYERLSHTPRSSYTRLPEHFNKITCHQVPENSTIIGKIFSHLPLSLRTMTGEIEIAPPGPEAATSPAAPTHPPGTTSGSGPTQPVINLGPTSNALAVNTWAERNPQKAVRGVRTQAKPTTAQNASQKIAALHNREAREQLSSDIICLVKTHKQEIGELAIKHSVTTQRVEKLVGNATHYKKARAPNLANAIAHLKAKELNEGMESQPFPCPAANIHYQIDQMAQRFYSKILNTQRTMIRHTRTCPSRPRMMHGLNCRHIAPRNLLQLVRLTLVLLKML